MDTYTVPVVSIILVLFLILSLRKCRGRNRNLKRKLPPGPPGLPVFGNLLSLEPLMYKTFCTWADKYGGIYSCSFLKTKAIVISDLDLAKELGSNLNMVGRFGMSAFDFADNGEPHGIFNTEGHLWEELHKFTLRTLRQKGIGKAEMEGLITTEVKDFIQVLMQEGEGGRVSIKDIKKHLFFPVLNPVWEITAGERLNSSANAELLQNSLDTVEEISTLLNSWAGVALYFMPEVAKFVAPTLSKYTSTQRILNYFGSFFEEVIKKQEENDDKENFVTTYLKKIKTEKDPTSPFFGETGRQHLLAVIADLYGGATDTTAATISWMFLYMAKFPEEQKRVQEEIDLVVGQKGHVRLEDRKNMPYSQAMIEEVLRFSSLASFSIQHRATEELKDFHGYYIPKGCLILLNTRQIHYSRTLWGDPNNFRPERFLHKEAGQKLFKRSEYMVPFSVGKRKCMGKDYAMDLLFLFGTNVLQKFSLELDGNFRDPGLEPELSFNLTPKPFRFYAKERRCCNRS